MGRGVYIPSYPTPLNGGGVQPGFRAGGFGGGGGEGGGEGPFVQSWPIFYNFEGDTVGDTVSVLNAKDTHYDIVTANATVQLDDYSTIPAILDDRLTNCVQANGDEAVGAACLVAAGDGFTPSGGRVLICEGLFYVTGTGSQSDIYIRDVSNQEGIHAYLYPNGNAYLRTATGGTWTAKYGPIFTTTTPHEQWHAFMVQYNFDTDQIYFRVIELGAGTEDSDWVGGGVITPTFDANTELRSFFPIARSDAASPVAVGQGYVADVIEDGYNLGAAGVHNYENPRWPVVLNYEGDTIGETGTELTAKDTHYDERAGAYVRADDYSILQDSGLVTRGLIQQGSGEFPISKILVADGEGFTPTDGGEMIFEGIGVTGGTNSHLGLRLGDEADQEGLYVEIYSNSNHYVRTRHLGVDTGNLIGPYGIGVSLVAQRWWYWGFRYHLTTKVCNARFVSLDGAFADTGWVNIGTLTGANYDTSVEWTKALFYVTSDTTAEQGIGQYRFAHYDVDGEGGDNLLTHNYKVP